MANKCMKNCSPSLPISEMQIRIALKIHLTPIRTAVMGGKIAGKDMEKKERLITVRNVK